MESQYEIIELEVRDYVSSEFSCKIETVNPLNFGFLWGHIRRYKSLEKGQQSLTRLLSFLFF